MIKHVVMWKFQKGQEQGMHEFLDGLMALKGQIEVIRDMQVGVNINEQNDFDAILIAEFDSMEDLEKYQKDPRHLAVANHCKEIREARVALDFEE